MPDGEDLDLDALEAAAARAETPCGDGRVVWHDWGQGKPLVLLHGGAGSWRHWARNIPVLSRHRRVLAPDTPGLGESDPPPPGTDLWGIARILAEGIAARIGAGTRYDLVGFSFGAVLSGHIAARHDSGMDSVTLVGAGSFGLPRSPTTLTSVRDRTGEARTAAHRANLAELMIADPARINPLALRIQAWNSDHARYRSRNVVGPSSLRDAVATARVPVRMIYGERDAIAHPHVDDRRAILQALHPGAGFRVIPGAGHWVAFEAADDFNAALAEMLGLPTLVTST